MPALKIFLEGDAKLTELEGKTEVGEVYAFSALPGGMKSGAASVEIVIQKKDGTFVLGETSMKLFLAAVRAFQIRYGRESEG